MATNLELKPLLLKIGNHSEYRWLYDESGRGLERQPDPNSDAEKARQLREVTFDACSRILDLHLLLLDFSDREVDFVLIIRLFKPFNQYEGSWDAIQESIHRFRHGMIAGGEYPELLGDMEAIRGFFDWLNSISTWLCYGIFCAWMLKRNLNQGLTAVSEKLPQTEDLIDAGEKLPQTEDPIQAVLDQLAKDLSSGFPEAAIADRHRAFLRAKLGIGYWTHAMRRLFADLRESSFSESGKASQRTKGIGSARKTLGKGADLGGKLGG